MPRRLAQRILRRAQFEAVARSAPLRSRLGLPSFLGIGAQKAGTTWLHDNLSAHPELFLPAAKEVHFFDREFARPLHWYAQHFEGAAGRLPGEVTPAYSILDMSVVAQIARIMPDLRLILLLRDPVERAWSRAVMNLAKRRGVEADEVSDEAFIAHFRSIPGLLRGDYLRTIDTWTQVFGSKALQVEFFESIREEPEALIRRVLRHIGVDAGLPLEAFPLRRVSNRGKGTPIRPQLRRFLEQLYQPDIQPLLERFGEPVARWPTAQALVARSNRAPKKK